MNQPEKAEPCPPNVAPRSGRSPELMNADDTVVLLVDVQQRLLPIINQSELVEWNSARLVQGANALGVEVVATEQYPEKLGPTVDSIAQNLTQKPVAKRSFSCVDGNDLLRDHYDAGRHRVLLAGIETHVCVQQTAFDLLASGFQVFLAADATGCRFPKDYEVALRRMEGSGVQITTTEAALFEWCRDSLRPEFKAISNIVKQAPPGTAKS